MATALGAMAPHMMEGAAFSSLSSSSWSLQDAAPGGRRVRSPTATPAPPAAAGRAEGRGGGVIKVVLV